MKNKLNKSSFLLGVMTTLLVACLIVPAMAAAMKTIQVSSDVNIYIDDKKLDPTDGNGDPVEVFIYNGTTYLPVRAVSEAVGKPVQWDGATRSVYLGKHSSDRPAAYLSKMDYFTKDGNWYFDRMEKDNLGVDHTNTLRRDGSEGSITYKLNGQYSRLTSIFFQRYDYRDANDKGANLVIYGDGNVIWQGSAAPDRDPINIDIDITGVLELTLEFPKGSGSHAIHTALGDVALWS